MAKRFTDDGELSRSPDSIELQQALERYAAAYRNRCRNKAPGKQPDPTWMRLYAASERLRLALREDDVAQAILEIGSNLIGCEEMAVLELHEDCRLSLLAGSGIAGGREQALASNTKAIATAIAEGRITMANTDASHSPLLSELGITAFVPVWHDKKPRGAIIFFRLLTQRSGFDASDRELLVLFSTFAGPSLFNTRSAR